MAFGQFAPAQDRRTLARMIREKFPGSYDDMTDLELEEAWVAKYPQYEDTDRTPAAAGPTPGMPESRTLRNDITDALKPRSAGEAALVTGKLAQVAGPITSAVGRGAAWLAPRVGNAAGAAIGSVYGGPTGAAIGSNVGGVIGKLAPVAASAVGSAVRGAGNAILPATIKSVLPNGVRVMQKNPIRVAGHYLFNSPLVYALMDALSQSSSGLPPDLREQMRMQAIAEGRAPRPQGQNVDLPITRRR